MVDTPSQSAGNNQSQTINKDNRPGKPNVNPGRGGSRSRGNRGKKTEKKKTGSGFKGACAEMNGHVYETHAECTTPGQFSRTNEEVYRYVTTKYKDGADVGRIVRNLRMFDINIYRPNDMPDYDSRSKLDQKLWDKEVEMFSERRRRFGTNQQSLFQLCWGQCSKLMISHLKTLDGWSERYDNSDCVWLLTEIQKAAARFESKKYLYLAVADAHAFFYRVQQHPSMTNEEYHTRFCQILKMFEHYDTDLGTDRVLVHHAMKEDGKSQAYIDRAFVGSPQWKKYCTITQQRFFAAMFLRNACQKRYGSLFRSLENSYARKTNQFPDTIADAYSLLLTYKKESDHDQPSSSRKTSNKTSNNSNNKDKENISPDEKDDDFAFLQSSNDAVCNTNIDLDAELSDIPACASGLNVDVCLTTFTTTHVRHGYYTPSNEDALSVPSLYEDDTSSSSSLSSFLEDDTASEDSSLGVPGLVPRPDDDSSVESEDSSLGPPALAPRDDESSMPPLRNAASVMSMDSSDDESFVPPVPPVIQPLRYDIPTDSSYSESSLDDDDSDLPSLDGLPPLIPRTYSSDFSEASSGTRSTTSLTVDTSSSVPSVSNYVRQVNSDDPNSVPGSVIIPPTCLATATNHSRRRLIPDTWILLDNESTANIFCNPRFLRDIYSVEDGDHLELLSNGGSLRIHQKGILPGFGPVWYSPLAVANILCFADVESCFSITYDQSTSTFTVTPSNGRPVPFSRPPNGKLYYYDASEHLFSSGSSSDTAFLFAQTIAEASAPYTQRQLRRVERVAETFQDMLSCDSTTFLHMVDNNLIRNANFNGEDARIYFDILGGNGRSEEGVRGRESRNTPSSVRPHRPPVPPAILRAHKDVTLCSDILFALGLPFLVTLSRHISMLSAHFLVSREFKTILPQLEFVINVYKNRGFCPKYLLTDMEFNGLRAALMNLGVELNPAVADEHVGDVERNIRIIKDDVRTLLLSLPFKKIPFSLLKHAVMYAVTMRNLIIRMNGVSQFLSPSAIVMGQSLDARVNCRLRFGAYCHVKIKTPTIASVTTPRSVAAIALRPVGNIQGGYYFMRLDTWKVVSRYQWQCFNMPADVIQQIEDRAEVEARTKTSQQNNDRVNMTFRSGNQTVLDDGDDDDDDDDNTPDNDTPGVTTTDDIEQQEDNTELHPEDLNDDDDSVTVESILNENDEIPTHTTDGNQERINENQERTSDNQERISGDQERTNGNQERQEQYDEDSEDDRKPSAYSNHKAGTMETTTVQEPPASDDDNDEVSSVNEEDELPLQPFELHPADRQYSEEESEDGVSLGHPRPPVIYEEATEHNVATARLSDVSMPSAANDTHMDSDYDMPPSTLLPSKRDRHAADNLTSDLIEDQILNIPFDPGRPGTARFDLRKRVRRGHSYVTMTASDDDLSKITPKTPPRNMVDCNSLWGMAFTQMSAREGLKRFGDRATEALVKEWSQLDLLNVYKGVHFYDLTYEQRKGALRLVQLIKEKRNKKVKGRTCVDGRPQREYIPKEKATSPTVITESLMLTFMIDALEDRCVGTVDIPGAFLTSDTDEFVIVIVDGVLVDMLLQSNPEYKKFVHVTKNGRKLVYLQLLKAMYGTLRAARIFFDNLTEYLNSLGFVSNPYDRCVMNASIEDHQCTITFHVDDLKVSHKYRRIVEWVMDRLQEKYNIQKLEPVIGSKHVYVGFDIEYQGDGSVHLTMASYLHDAINDFPEELGAPVKTPCADYLFEVNPTAEPLPEDRREIFHKIVARLLFVSTRARPDIHVGISFLTSRCSKADVQDWRKLKRLLTYLRDTIDLPLILKADSMSVIKWWVDAAYGVRDDYRSQTGASMSFGLGTICNKSAKQGINTKSSTEAELVAASDMVPHQLWTRNFLIGQGYNIDQSLLYQDNQSAILLERNGMLSSTKRTKHINIRFFWLADRIDNGELSVEYVPTDNMIADYLTKPLQGSKFLLMRDQIMGHAPIP